MFIAVSQRITKLKKIKESRDSLDVRLTKLLFDCNLKPILIPNVLNSKKKLLNSLLTKLKLKGLVLTGGEDFGKNKNRDETELNLLNWALKNSLPILGICRGMQLIGKYNNVKLERISNHVKKYHAVSNKSKIYKFDKKVNSYHEYRISKCPKGFQVSAISNDNTIKAIESKKFKTLAIMWHPERNRKISKNDISNIKTLFKINEKKSY